MWPFKSKSLKSREFFRGFSDVHAHILPGVDDGAATLDLSLELLATYDQLGVKRLQLTPHIMEDYPNETQELNKRFHELQSAYSGNVKLSLSAEYMLDSLFLKRLEIGDLLPWGVNNNQLLVETSYFNPPMNLMAILQQIKQKGFFPVLAHPERYVYMNSEYYDNLKNIGILFQLNIFSLVGFYGSHVQKCAFELLNKGYYDFIGSDVHRISMMQMIEKSIPNKVYNKILKLKQNQS